MIVLTEFTNMDSKRAFCPGLSSRMDQHMIKDHMISHYKKVYSAKSAVDCTVPKSMRSNVKYIDQKSREQLKKNPPERSLSLRSLSQRSMRLITKNSCSLRNTRPYTSVGESGDFCMGVSEMSSPRFSSSFHCKQIVYPSRVSQSSSHGHPSLELSYRNPKSQLHHYSHSCVSSITQQNFKSFQDPVQKTYSGDVLVKHSHLFTEEKPFTPRTLKSNGKSTLCTYRYYNPSNRKTKEEKTLSKINQKGIYCKRQRVPSVGQESPQQPYDLYHEWSDEESNVPEHYSQTNKCRDNDLLLSSSRVSPEGMRSPTMKKITAEEEELVYMEFIADVTNEIIARGIYSDRVLERVFERHIEINKHHLDEKKMRHLLDVLQNDLQRPPSASISTLENKERDSSLMLRHEYLILDQELTLEKTGKTSPSPWTHFNKDTNELQDPLSLDSTILAGIAESDGSIRQIEENGITDLEPNHREENLMSPDLNDHSMSEEDKHQNYIDSEIMDQLDELGKTMEKSLCVSEVPHSQEATEEELAETLSDDEF